MYQNDVGRPEDEPSRFDTQEGVKSFWEGSIAAMNVAFLNLQKVMI